MNTYNVASHPLASPEAGAACEARVAPGRARPEPEPAAPGARPVGAAPRPAASSPQPALALQLRPRPQPPPPTSSLLFLPAMCKGIKVVSDRQQHRVQT